MGAGRRGDDYRQRRRRRGSPNPAAPIPRHALAPRPVPAKRCARRDEPPLGSRRKRAPEGRARLAHPDGPRVAMARPLGAWRRVDRAATLVGLGHVAGSRGHVPALYPGPRSAARVGVARGVSRVRAGPRRHLDAERRRNLVGDAEHAGLGPGRVAATDGSRRNGAMVFERLVQHLPALSPLHRRRVLPPDARPRMASRHGLRRFGPSPGARHQRPVRERVDGGRNPGGRLPRRGQSVRSACRDLCVDSARADRAIRLLREDHQRRSAIRLLVRGVARLLPPVAADAGAPPLRRVRRHGNPGHLYRRIRPTGSMRSRRFPSSSACGTQRGGAACSIGASRPPPGRHS